MDGHVNQKSRKSVRWFASYKRTKVVLPTGIYIYKSHANNYNYAARARARVQVHTTENLRVRLNQNDDPNFFGAQDMLHHSTVTTNPKMRQSDYYFSTYYSRSKTAPLL